MGRLSGYILFPLFFSTVHLGGAWSDWAVDAIPWVLRFLVYTLAPGLVLVSIFWRMRWVLICYLFERTVLRTLMI